MASSPFLPITAEEIRETSEIVRNNFKGLSVRFKAIDFFEPPKAEVLQYYESGVEVLYPDRRTKVYCYISDGFKHKIVVNLKSKVIQSNEIIDEALQFGATVDETTKIEKLCNNHPLILSELAKLELPKTARVVNDPWCYGTDEPAEKRRLFQCYMYIAFSDHPEANHYANPLPLAPVFDADSFELLWITKLPMDEKLADQSEEFQAMDHNNFQLNDYHEEGQASVRGDLKPLQYVQPDGASFTVQQNRVYWQKWELDIGWNAREGAVLHNVKFDGRPVFYRVSINELTVPYADPRPPYHRKQAFDLGDAGFGVTANQLALGCDCLGLIKYFDGYLTDATGQPVLMKNVVCMHEVDNGIQWKHTNFRTPHVSSVVRKRELIIQTVATVANYEYIVMLILDQAANLRIDIRATGILSTVPCKDGVILPYATRLGPGVQAPYHQHIFSLRLDPAIDDYHNNSVVYEDVVPLEPSDGVEDRFKCGFKVRQSTVKKPGFIDFDLDSGRYLKVINPNVINPVSKKPVGYRLWHITSQKILMDPSSYNVRRGEFGLHPFWVSKYRDQELYAAGEFTNQSQADTGLKIWSKRDENVENDDCVLWHTFSLTHIPRPEDFPVMPCDMLSLELKPSGFFEKNPTLNIPRSAQAHNHSSLVKDFCCNL
jgi:primary-amine oxidase